MKHISQFSLFQSHIDLAHSYWKACIKPGDRVIDATCGNGYDLLALAEIMFTDFSLGQLIAIDRQREAIESSRERLQSTFPQELVKNIVFVEGCHSVFSSEIEPDSVALIVYNLGYLPGGNKEMTTMSSTTIQSLNAALPLIRQGGMISITCYPGHGEGELEEHLVKEFAASLDPKKFSSCYHSWLNRRKSPGLMIIQKAKRKDFDSNELTVKNKVIAS